MSGARRQIKCVSSDACETMNGVEQADSAEQAEGFNGSAFGAALDPVDVVRGLAHLDVLRDCVIRARRGRLAARVAAPRTEKERHLAEHGHEFGFGCCREDTPQAA